MSRFLRRLHRRDNRPLQLSTRPQFDVDQTLVERQIAEAEKLGPNSIKRVLPAKHVEDQPDTFVAAPFVSELPIG